LSIPAHDESSYQYIAEILFMMIYCMDTCAELQEEKLSEVHSVTQMERRELDETGKEVWHI